MRMREDTKKRDSEWRIATVFGRVSPNTSKVIVLATVAIITPLLSPINVVIITVARAAKAVLARLLPRSMVGRTFSGWSTILATLSAPAAFLSCRCRILTFLNERKAASELEKKAESSREGISSIRYIGGTCSMLLSLY